jgi:hypothetical protein
MKMLFFFLVITINGINLSFKKLHINTSQLALQKEQSKHSKPAPSNIISLDKHLQEPNSNQKNTPPIR